MELPPGFTLGTVTLVPGQPDIWLATDGRNGSVYRAKQSGGEISEWELVWEYAYPESIHIYAPYKFIADKANPGRIYGLFQYDTRHPHSDGLLVSEDYGLNWRMTGVNGDARMALLFPDEPVADPNKAGRIWMRGGIVMDMNDDVHLSLRGLFVSEDAGRRWQRVAGLDEVHAAVLTPQGPLIAGTRTELDAQQQATTYLLTSTDGGSSWQERKLPGHLGGWRIHADTVSSRTMVAFGSDNEGVVVTRCDDGSATWSVPARMPAYSQVLYAAPGLKRLMLRNGSGELVVLDVRLGS